MRMREVKFEQDLCHSALTYTSLGPTIALPALLVLPIEAYTKSKGYPMPYKELS